MSSVHPLRALQPLPAMGGFVDASCQACVLRLRGGRSPLLCGGLVCRSALHRGHVEEGVGAARVMLDPTHILSFYSQNLFQKDIFTAVGWLPAGKKMSAIEEVYKIARAQSIIALCSTVPGYWFTVALIDHIGRFTIQLIGFFFMTAFMFALAIPYDHWRGTKCGADFCGGNPTAFVVLYSFTFFFANFGPNSTTFIVPAELFPARFRSTCHGISAASGKAGAIIGAFAFLYAAQSTRAAEVEPGYTKGIGVKNSLIVLGVINALGFLFTFLVPETNGKSLEELSGENGQEESTQVQTSRAVQHI